MKTALFPAQDRRQELRYSLFGTVPVRMINMATNSELSFTPVDISRRGLGLLVTPSPLEGQSIRLDFLNAEWPSLQLICRHVYLVTEDPVSGFETLRRCGFELQGEQQAQIDLVELFAGFESIIIGD